MSGTSRQGYNLFTNIGWSNFVHEVRWGRWRWPLSFIWGDTVGPLCCAVVGHRGLYWSDKSDHEIACRVCHRYIAVKE